ncbi:MAG: hypothetical protein Q8Q08_01445 [Candidatus Omnitrophota bacterium]|nr:hypothetical protein [Candidatus Omnitrophota bacterium]MDZ4242761.1 hypothetical protein [Candidatus Omnitrophota bacterium]
MRNFDLKTIASFLNNHFEEILAFNAYLLLGMCVIILFLQVRHLRLKHFQQFLRQILFYVTIVVETSLIAITVMIFIENYSPKKPIDFAARIAPNTRWVKEDTPIYFLADNRLVMINPDGSGRKTVFEADETIRQYQFSPDGKNLLVLTRNDLYLLDIAAGRSERLTSVRMDNAADKDQVRGAIDGVRWAPDSAKFCYRLSRWSAYSAVEDWWIYDIRTKSRVKVQSPVLKFVSLFWDRPSTHLYASWFESLDTTKHANPYHVKIFRIPLSSLNPETVIEFPFSEPRLKPEHLAVRGIDLDFGVDRLTFSNSSGAGTYHAYSRSGAVVGIDERDTLYFIRNLWWRRRLYQIPRVTERTALGEIARYQYQGGQLVIRDLRWLPGGRYVIMEHLLFGILILDPSTGKIGILDSQRGSSFGWYSP